MIGEVYVCDDRNNVSGLASLSTLKPLGDGTFAFIGRNHILCKEIVTVSVLENVQVFEDFGMRGLYVQKCLVVMKNHKMRIAHMLLEMNLWMMKRVGDGR